jgi:hypothetical protein
VQNLTYLVSVLVAGIWTFVEFGLGFAGGIFSIKRKRFRLSVVGISRLLVGGLLSVFGMGILGGGLSFGMIIGICSYFGDIELNFYWSIKKRVYLKWMAYSKLRNGISALVMRAYLLRRNIL